MEELQVPTRQIPVEVYTDRGDRVRGVLFAPELGQPPQAVEQTLEILNDLRRFLPVSVEGTGRPRTLLGKHHIVRVRVERNGGDPAPDGCQDDIPAVDGEMDHTFWLSDGSCVSGRPVVQTRRSASRLLDKLNQAAVFVAVFTTAGVEILHRDHVVRAE